MKRLSRWFGRAALVALLPCTYLGALVLGAWLHLGLNAPRRVVAASVSRGLSSLFMGEISIASFDRISLRQLWAREVRVLDPEGRQVLRVDELRIRADLVEIAQQLAWGDGHETLVIEHVRMGRAEGLILQPTATSIPTIGQAFTPSRRSPRTGEPTRRVRVLLGEIELGQAWARVELPQWGKFEADVGEVRGRVLATNKGAAVDTERFGMVARGLLGSDARGTAEVHVQAPGSVWSGFDGFVGDVYTSLFMHLKRRHLIARVELPRAKPEDARALAPWWPLHDELQARLKVEGDLPALEAEMTAELGRARLRAAGQVHLEDELRMGLDVAAQQVDLRSFVPSAPETQISVTGHVDLQRRQDQLLVSVTGTTEPATVAGQEVPAVDLSGSYHPPGLSANATLHETGMPLALTLAVHPDGTMALDAHARSFYLQRSPRIARVSSIRGLADVRLSARVKDDALAASVQATVEQLELGSLGWRQARVEGELSGALSRPRELAVEAELGARGASLGGISFDDVEVSASGLLRHPRLRVRLRDPGRPTVEASGLLGLPGPTVSDLRLALHRGDSRLEGKVALVELGPDSLRVQAVELAGLGGELHGSFRYGPERFELSAEGAGLDLEALSTLLGLPEGQLGGSLELDAELVFSGAENRGELAVALEDGAYSTLRGIDLSVRSSLTGSHLTGQGELSVVELGGLGVEYDTHLGGPVLATTTWRDLVGTAQVRLRDLELGRLASFVPSSLSVERLGGTGQGEFQVMRHFAGALPSVTGWAETKGLEVDRSGVDPGPAGAQGWATMRGMDLQAGISFNGESGYTLGMAHLVDSFGMLLSASGQLEIDLPEAVRAPESLGTQLRATPLRAVVALPERAISELPPALGVPPLAGRVSAKLNLDGTANDPIAMVTVTGHEVTPAPLRTGLPVDLSAALQYQKRTGRFGGSAEVTAKGRKVALASVQGVAQWEDLLAEQEPTHPRWTGEAQAVFLELPLAVHPRLALGNVQGHLSGSLALVREGAIPEGRATLQARGLAVGAQSLGEADLWVRTSLDDVRAGLEVRTGAGTLTGDARLGLDHAKGLPQLDPTEPVALQIKARELESALFAPLVSGVLTEVRGPLDATVKAEFRAREAADTPPGTVEWRSRIEGTAQIRGGTVQIAGLDMEIADLWCQAKAEPFGPTTRIRIEGLRGKSRSNDVNVRIPWAHVFIDSHGLQSGNAAVQLDRTPLSLGGVSLAAASGSILLELEREEERMHLVVTPEVLAELTRSATRVVHDTKENPEVKVLQSLEPPRRGREKGVMPWLIDFDLSHQVSLELSGLQVPIRGRPQVLLGPETVVSGYIDLQPGGRLPIFGRPFVIEVGRIWLDPAAPTNPRLNIVASWQGPQATVYVTLRGRFDSLTPELESDPPYSTEQILVLVQGGSPDDAASAQEGQNQQITMGALRALGVQELLAGTMLGDLDIGASTSEMKQSYTAGYRINDKVRVEGIYRREDQSSLETPSSEGNLNTDSERDDFAAAVEYQFHPNWSIRTEAGSASAAMDLLWQYRY